MFFLGLIIGTTCAHAQSKGKVLCKSDEWLKEIDDKIKVEGHWDEAYDLWNAHFANCTKGNEQWYQLGDELLENRWSFAATNDKRTWVSRRIQHFQAYDRQFPRNKQKHQVQLARLMDVSGMFFSEQISAAYDRAFNQDPSLFTDPELFAAYWTATAAWQKKHTPNFQEVFMDRFLDLAIPLFKEKRETLGNQEQTNWEFLCNVLIQNLTKEEIVYWAQNNFVCFKNQGSELNVITRLLKQLKVTDSSIDLYAAQLDIVQPSSFSAELLAERAVLQRKVLDALHYFKFAIDRSGNKLYKATTYYKMALVTQSTDKEKAQIYLIEATQTDPSFSRGYLQLMELYLSETSCLQSAMEQKALAYLAIQQIEAIEKVDSRLAATLQKRKGILQQQLPTDQELKKAQIIDRAVDLGCWVHQTISFPAK
ncbi:MAG: hypothetical protein CFE24_07080 [Flavobacterium sp. BFFFF2]|nr:MAG: hypothetical protein CFE24_07080 [Flavobacterium sp. BFFFF2]